MTDRVKGLIVTLDRDIRIDDVEHAVNAVKMIKGVSSVQLSISTPEDHMARARVMSEIRDKLYDFIQGL